MIFNQFKIQNLSWNKVFWKRLERDVLVEADVCPEVDAEIADVGRCQEVALRRHGQRSHGAWEPDWVDQVA